MIGKLKGNIEECFDDHAIIDVGGVGYLVYASAKVLHQLKPGQRCEFFIDTHVREDHIHLYGFLSVEEKRFFLLFQQVSGVGARMAMAILSTLSPIDIQYAISSKDKEAFRSVSGVGPKLAERIIIELKDKVPKSLQLNGPLGDQKSNSGIHYPPGSNDNIVTQAVSALVNLGINRSDAYNSVMNIIAQDKNITIDELIKLALKSRAS